MAIRSASINTATGMVTGGGSSWPTGGGGGSANTAQAIVDFGTGTPQDTTANAIAAAAWVTGTSVLVCSVMEGQDHTADEISAEEVTATIGTVVPGVGFTVSMSAPNGASGKFLVNIAGF